MGDILHSRVARSTSLLMKRLGMEVAFLGPGSLVPRTEHSGIPRFSDFNEAFAWKPDVIYLLRVQKSGRTPLSSPAPGSTTRFTASRKNA